MMTRQALTLMQPAQMALNQLASTALTVDLSAASGRDVTVAYVITGTATGSGTDFTLAEWNAHH